LLKIGSRKSKLALAQSLEIKKIIEEKLKIRCKLITFDTQGDLNLSNSIESLANQQGFYDKGLFTKELESSLISGEIDLAVHSLKDLPVVIENKKLLILAITKRICANDVLICANKHRDKNLDSLENLPENARLGTCSPRRKYQIKLIRPDLKFEVLRGNIETRIEKIKKSKAGLDAGILAYAGLKRRKIECEISQILNFDQSVPAPGQGALAIQTSLDFYSKNQALYFRLFKILNDQATRFLVSLERNLLNFTQAGCSSPFGAYVNFKTRKAIELRIFYSKDNFYLKKKYSIEIKNLRRDFKEIKNELKAKLN